MPRKPTTPAAEADCVDALTSSVLRGQLRSRMTFAQRVWALTAQVPAGRVTTYGRLAAALDSRSPRAVGQALHRNPHAPAVPCHRVVGSDGSLTGFAGGLSKKRQLLLQEGVPIVGDKVNLTCLHCFTSR